MEEKVQNENQTVSEMTELNDQFKEFLNTKGIVAKFKLAFANMGEAARKQHEKDVAKFNEVKAKSAEENKEFVQFLQTKGIKAKFQLVIENIKKGAQNAQKNTAEQIAKTNEMGQESIARAKSYAPKQTIVNTVSAQTLENEFNAFLKSKGLDGKYIVSVVEEN